MLSRRELANAVRVLSMDAVQSAQSGHPGAPMGMADIAEVLWNDFLRHNPSNPKWPDRDRFIMSNGHGSMLLYALLHLSGYELPMEHIRRFRQLYSKAPGHPEYGETPGVETTTGPLGQGLANAVGMAISERNLAAEFNRGDLDIVNHYTYVTVGDGCLMEGISHEACSLAGTLGLGKLICIYDSNKISIDGDVSGWFTDDTVARFESYGWHVVRDVDGHNAEQIIKAITEAHHITDRPSLIYCHTVIGWGAPNKQGDACCHGAPLGDNEIALARQTLAWEHEPFVIPNQYYASWDATQKGKKLEAEWQEKFRQYAIEYPKFAAEFSRRISKQLPKKWDPTVTAHIQETAAKIENIASRQSSQNTLNAYAQMLPELIGGSADLTNSNMTLWSGSKKIAREAVVGNYIYYGVREFAMAAINTGIALHGGYIPYGGTFLIFSEYARNALRMAALMGVRSIFVLSHDSIALGEDGPTHQAIEQAATLRLIPNMTVWRPCDSIETAVAWQMAIEKMDGPSCLLLSRQSLRQITRNKAQIDNIKYGGYILIEGTSTPDLVVIATGSEVALAENVVLRLNEHSEKIRLISMPSCDYFDAQPQSYRDKILPPNCRKRIAVEAGIQDYWRKYVGLDGEILGIEEFGKSAPAKDIFAHFDLTETKLEKMIQNIL